MACVAKLRFAAVRVTLVDRRNFHLFQPLLYQVATGSLSPADIATPIRGVMRDQPKVRVVHQTVTAVDPAQKCVTTDQGTIPYDFLVIATGASHGYFGHQEWAQYAPGLKSVEDAIAIRRRVLTAFEKAENTVSSTEQQRLLTFVVCGGGPTGVELAGALAELARNGLQQEFRSIDPASAKIILVQSGVRLLPAFDERLSEAARASLVKLGVEVRLKSRVESIDGQGVVINGDYLPAGVVLWTAGVVASPAARWLGLEPDKAGRVVVGEDLSAPGCPGVYVIGDTALSLGWKGQPAPGLAAAAKQSGAHVARVIAAAVAGGRLPTAFQYRHQGSLATIGRKAAVADFGAFRLHGSLAWWIWGTIHLFFLLGTRNRIAVGVGWIWSYFTYETAVQLITEDQANDERGLVPDETGP
jgi:NADH dehydrogenase FAD-containing subunit